MAAQHQIEAVGQAVQRHGGVHIQLGNQRAHRIVAAYRLQDGATNEQRIAFEIHLRDQPLRERLAGEREVNMRRTPVADLIAPGVRARLDGAKTVIPVVVGQHPAAAAKIGIDRRQILILLVTIAPSRIGLPYLDQGVAHRRPEGIAHISMHDDPLADR